MERAWYGRRRFLRGMVVETKGLKTEDQRKNRTKEEQEQVRLAGTRLVGDLCFQGRPD